MLRIKKFTVRLRTWQPQPQTECWRYLRQGEHGIAWLTADAKDAKIWSTLRGAQAWLAKRPYLAAEIVAITKTVTLWPAPLDLVAVWHNTEVLDAQAS